MSDRIRTVGMFTASKQGEKEELTIYSHALKCLPAIPT